MNASARSEEQLEDIILSIITVVKDDPIRLLKTINSLQNFYGSRQIEHVIIDGKSDYETLNIIGSVKKFNNVKFLSEEDKGIYDAMNKGVLLASGKYLLFLNCGDEVIIDKKQILSSLSNTPDADILCFPCQLNDGLTVLNLSPKLMIKHKMPTSHQGMFILKNYIVHNLYDVRYRIAADYDLYLSAIFHRVAVLTKSNPITSIQLQGYSSENPYLSYKEYLIIAFRRLSGVTRISAIVKIALKGLFIIILKKFLPAQLVRSLGAYFK
jgi:putative colanic acid biosynthesis glycosyltransferase